MRVFLITLGFVAISLGSLAMPVVAQAQAGLVTCSGLDCNACKLAELVNNVINFIIGMMVLVAVILLVVAGFKMVVSAGKEEALSSAKATFTNVVIGFVLVLAAWLIVDTVVRGLTGSGLNALGPVTCGGMVTPHDTEPDEVLLGVQPYESGTGAGGLSDAEARALMEQAGIVAKEGVSYDGLQPHVVEAATTLTGQCGCEITVTAATDGNHASGDYSHGNGYKLDLRTRDNPALLDYVQSLPSAGSWSDGTKLYQDSQTCGTYAVESDHVDVVYKPSCPAGGI